MGLATVQTNPHTCNITVQQVQRGIHYPTGPLQTLGQDNQLVPQTGLIHTGALYFSYHKIGCLNLRQNFHNFDFRECTSETYYDFCVCENAPMKMNKVRLWSHFLRRHRFSLANLYGRHSLRLKIMLKLLLSFDSLYAHLFDLPWRFSLPGLKVKAKVEVLSFLEKRGSYRECYFPL